MRLRVNALLFAVAGETLIYVVLVIWVAHAFWVVPVMIALTKYHVKST